MNPTTHFPISFLRAAQRCAAVVVCLVGSAGLLADEVLLTWSDNSDNEDGFSIERATGEDGFEVIGQTGVDVETYTDDTAEPGLQYRYRVNAFNAFGYSGYTNVSAHYINVAPTVSAIESLVVEENEVVEAVAFTVSDFEAAAEDLSVEVTSSNAELLDETGIVVSGNGASRTLSLTPKPDVAGEALVRVSVSDGEDSTASEFTYLVKAFVYPSLAVSVETVGSQARAGEAFVVSGSASDESKVSSVAYYLEGELVESVEASPYELEFGIPEPGSYTLEAVASLVGRGDTVRIEREIVVGAAPAESRIVAGLKPISVDDFSSEGTAGYELADDRFYLEDGAGEIAGSADTNRYYYLMAEGDVFFTAQLAGLQVASQESVAGLMARSALYGKAVQTSLLVTAAGELEVRTRSERGGSTAVVETSVSDLADVWLGIEKTGTQVRYYWKASAGSDWSLLAEEILDLGEAVFVGFAVAGGSSEGLARASFGNVSLVGEISSWGENATEPVVPSGLIISSARD